VAGIDLTTRVREVADFPEPGVGFKDISPLLLDPEALR
jgi:adenine phosphoribosyltransferase